MTGSIALFRINLSMYLYENINKYNTQHHQALGLHVKCLGIILPGQSRRYIFAICFAPITKLT